MTFKDTLRQRAKKVSSTKVLNKIGLFDVILAPIFTEKTYKQQESVNKYYFKVHKDANKNDVRDAVIYLYKVTPLKINVLNVVFKWRGQRKLVRKSYKKAIITLNKKDKIEIWA